MSRSPVTFSLSVSLSILLSLPLCHFFFFLLSGIELEMLPQLWLCYENAESTDFWNLLYRAALRGVAVVYTYIFQGTKLMHWISFIEIESAYLCIFFIIVIQFGVILYTLFIYLTNMTENKDSTLNIYLTFNISGKIFILFDLITIINIS